MDENLEPATTSEHNRESLGQDSLATNESAHLRKDFPEQEKKPEIKDQKGNMFLQYSAETSTIQGPAKMWAAPLFFLKVIWLVFLLGASGIMLYQLVKLFQQYFRWEVKTEISLGFGPLALPAVTVCNANSVRLSQAHKLSCNLQEKFGIPESHQNPVCRNASYQKQTYDFSSFDCYGDCDGNVSNATTQQYYVYVGAANESRSLLEEVGHEAKDMILTCSIVNRACYLTNFIQSYSTFYGNCYTVSLPDKKVTTSGDFNGLDLILNIESEEYLQPAGYGLRVVVHEHGTRPSASDAGFTVAGGSDVLVGLKMAEITRLASPHGSCDDGKEYKRQTGNSYTIQGCRDLCVTASVLQNCSCFPLLDDFAIMTTDNYCNTEKEVNCMNHFLGYYYAAADNGIDICNCRKPCRETVYQTTIASYIWPLLTEVGVLEKISCYTSPASQKCSYQDQHFDFNNIDSRRMSFIRLRVYYESLNYEIITEKPSYEIERFLSDIGGTLGLWIGGSVLVIGEVFELVVLLLVKCHRNVNTSGNLHITRR